MVAKIISGGQTGADQGGLHAARCMGVATGGYAPKDFMTEKGTDHSLPSYGLVDSGLDYAGRTELNVKHSDITIWFGYTEASTGFRATQRAARKHKKKLYCDKDEVFGTLVHLFKTTDIINIAGNRGSASPKIYDYTKGRIMDVMREVGGDWIYTRRNERGII